MPSKKSLITVATLMLLPLLVYIELFFTDQNKNKKTKTTVK